MKPLPLAPRLWLPAVHRARHHPPVLLPDPSADTRCKYTLLLIRLHKQDCAGALYTYTLCPPRALTQTAVAPTPADYTNLGSFGDAEQFGNNMVAQMDRSFMNRSPWKPKQPVQVGQCTALA